MIDDVVLSDKQKEEIDKLFSKRKKVDIYDTDLIMVSLGNLIVKKKIKFDFNFKTFRNENDYIVIDNIMLFDEYGTKTSEAPNGCACVVGDGFEMELTELNISFDF